MAKKPKKAAEAPKKAGADDATRKKRAGGKKASKVGASSTGKKRAKAAKAKRAAPKKRARRGQRRAYALITNPKGKVLLVRNRRGRWTLPGGRARKAERLRDAATREVREETGLRITTRKRLSGEHVRRHRRPCARCVVFRASVDKGKPRPNREIVEVAWVNPQKVAKRLRAFQSKEIERLLARKA